MKSMPTVLIRTARRTDFQCVRQLVFDMDGFHHMNAPDRIKPPERATLNETDFDEFLDDGVQTVFVAEQNGKVVGFIRARIQSTPEGRAHRPRRAASILEIVVYQRARRLGIGRRLMEAVYDWSSRHEAESVELGVYAFNIEALNFYHSLGFSDLTLRLAKVL